VTVPEDDAFPGELTVRLETEGGFGVFPGLRGPVELSTRDLDPGGDRQLRALIVEAFRTGERPAQPGSTQPGSTQPGSTQPGSTQPGSTPPGGPADVRTYTVTVTVGGGSSRCLSVRDPVPAGPLQALIRYLQEHHGAGG
jgi:hypothetical protein